MRIACISDTHNHFVEVESCDLIIHAGDAFHAGMSLVRNELQWFNSVRKQFKRWREIAPVVVIFGNHDPLAEECSQWFYEEFEKLNINSIIHNSLIFQEIRLWGSAIQPIFNNWAFNVNDETRQRKFAQIEPCDILITHCPPYGILDQTENGEHVGDKILHKRVEELQPKYHIFGHCHHDINYGIKQYGKTKFVNCAVTDENYQLARKPIYIDYKHESG